VSDALPLPEVLLRPLLPQDSDALFRWINDRETVVFNAPFEPVARADHDRWFEAINTCASVRIFAIVERASGALIGSCQLLNITPRHRSAELQIRIGEPAYRGKGHGTQAVKALLDYGFGRLGLHRIALTVRADNERAIRSYRKAGLLPEGVLRDAAFIEGRYVDLLCMAVLAP
jgi:RimJ/RimL family protein N-acetyltransferase